MYDMKGFGARIAALRKADGMTQDDLAQRLGITAQAVSKWENDLAYPDITIIPTLCAIFEVSLDDLFGKSQKTVNDLAFSPTFKGIPLVATFANIACYSEKEAEDTGGSTVTFKDGSIAELESRRIVNKGAGQIYLKSIDDFADGGVINSNTRDNEIISTSHEYGEVLSLECSSIYFNCDTSKVDGEVSTIDAEGYAGFMELLEFDYDSDKKHLEIGYDQQKYKAKFNDNINMDIWDLSKNTIKIRLSCPNVGLDSTVIKINAAGDINLNIPTKNFNSSINGSGKIIAKGISFDDAHMGINGAGEVCFENAVKLKSSINGSGHIEFNNVAELNSSINGSGILKFNEVGSAKSSINGSGQIEANDIKIFDASINGSGDIEIGECGELKIGINGSGILSTDKITQSVDVSIRGSGDVSIKEGEVETFKVRLDNGEVNARGVTTKRADIKLPHHGRVEIGRVIEESIEVCGDHAELIVHNRG